MVEQVLKAIEQAGEEDSKLYVKAAVKRREELLNGGEVGYMEFSKEWVEHRDRLWVQVQEYLAQEDEVTDSE